MMFDYVQCFKILTTNCVSISHFSFTFIQYLYHFAYIFYIYYVYIKTLLKNVL